MKVSQLWKLTILRKLLQNEITEDRTYFVLTLVTGILAGVVAVFFQKSVHFLTHLFQTNEPFTLWALIMGGISIFISGLITTRFFPSTAGSGIPGVRVALAVYHGKITFVSAMAKLVTSVFSLASGISLGREGPTVSIAAGVGSSLGTFFSMSKKRVKALVAIGSAGGIAAAFYTPISAVVFTLEEIVGDLNAKVLGSIIISSVLASVTAQYLTGNASTFSDLHYKLNDPRELVFYLAIGLLASVMGPLWVKSVLKLRETNAKIFKGHKLTIILLSFLIIAGLSHVNKDVLGSGHETIEETLLSLIIDWRVLLSLFVLKFIATTVCYSSGMSGGLFMPTLLMGAMLGALVGSLANIITPDLTSNIGAYALVGMGAYFASVIRAPFTSILIVFEMTRDYNIILPLMIANVVAYIISSRLLQGSIYENISEQDGIHLPGREDSEILESLVVEDAMIKDPISLNANLTVKQAIKEIKGHEFSGYPVLKNGVLVGMISSNELASAYTKGFLRTTIFEICTKRIYTIYPDQSLLVAFHKLKKYQISRLPVVSRLNDRRIVGIITAEDIVSKFGYHIAEEHHQEISPSLAQEIEKTTKEPLKKKNNPDTIK